MFFEAESNGTKYEINVNETGSHWKLGIRAEGEDWVYYDVSKHDYQHIDSTISFLFKNSSYLVDVIGSGTEYTVFTRGTHRSVKIYNEEALLHESLKGGKGFGDGDNLSAGMPGKIVKVFVKAGEEVKEGDPLLIMEAMKMENEMRADGDLKIKSIHVKEGDNVESGALLIAFDK